MLLVYLHSNCLFLSALSKRWLTLYYAYSCTMYNWPQKKTGKSQGCFAGATIPKKKIICEGDKETIECRKPKVINVTAANYGRTAEKAFV